MPNLSDLREVNALSRRCPHCGAVIGVSLARHVADTGSATTRPEWACPVLFEKRNRVGSWTMRDLEAELDAATKAWEGGG